MANPTHRDAHMESCKGDYVTTGETEAVCRSEADEEALIVKFLKLDQTPEFRVPRLYYFNARGRAEIIRLVFALRGVRYEDLRCRGQPYAMKDFAVLKKHKKLPFGQVPLLEINGLSLVQSQAILRYLGRQYDLIGSSETEATFVDIVACATEDMRQKFTSSLFTWKETEAGASCLRIFKNETCPQWGRYLSRILEDNGGIWFVGNRVTYADLAVYDTITHIQMRIPEAFQSFELLRLHTERIKTIPEIAAWLKARRSLGLRNRRSDDDSMKRGK